MHTDQPLPTGNIHIKPRKALNKVYLKVKPNRSQIENFKQNLIELLDRSNETESEEFHKNLVSDFLKRTYYHPNHFINTKGRKDLVVHNSNKTNSESQTYYIIRISNENPCRRHLFIRSRNR